jgi:class 3 adenylate cyclase
MYRTNGDAPSYRTVRLHFDLMRRIIDSHNGAIVKTIGDAVMATFCDPAEGLSAALEVQRETRKLAGNLPVKIGLHYGPAIAVTANDRLDYFGQTVNLAARIQNEAGGGEVVISTEVAEDPGVKALLAAFGIGPEPFEATVRGLDEPVTMLHIPAAAIG